MRRSSVSRAQRVWVALMRVAVADDGSAACQRSAAAVVGLLERRDGRRRYPLGRQRDEGNDVETLPCRGAGLDL